MYYADQRFLKDPLSPWLQLRVGMQCLWFFSETELVNFFCSTWQLMALVVLKPHCSWSVFILFVLGLFSWCTAALVLSCSRIPQICPARSALCGMWSSGAAGMFLEFCLQQEKLQFSRRNNSHNCHWSVLTLVPKAPSERTQSGSFILMKFCLTQAITHSPSSDFCEVPAQRMLLMTSLKRLPGICSYELLPARLCFERERNYWSGRNSECRNSPAEWSSSKNILVF